MNKEKKASWHKRITKKLVPESLFTRMLMIIIIPTVIAQLVSTYIFYHRHWDNVSHSMLYSLAGEISFISELHQKLSNKDIKTLKTYTNLRYKFFKDKKIEQKKNKLSNELKILEQNLKQNINSPLHLSYDKRDKEVEVEVQMKEGVLFFEVSRSRFYTPTTYIFIIWMIGITSVLLVFTIIFSKNQIRSITKLSSAAQRFGTLQSVDSFKPEGAIEVRKAGIAFLEMKQRIENQIKQRTEMLAGVSHDLRTPITRIKLELALMKQEDTLRNISADIQEMENIINDYLDFAKDEKNYKTSKVFLSKILSEVVEKYSHSKTKITLELDKKIEGNIRISPFKRAIQNLLDNATRFASEISISLRTTENSITIEINDNGPGITRQEIKKVFQPFYRVEHSRNQATGGVGLGLSITQDIILRHGGNISLDKSKLGGLKVNITLPK